MRQEEEKKQDHRAAVGAAVPDAARRECQHVRLSFEGNGGGIFQLLLFIIIYSKEMEVGYFSYYYYLLLLFEGN